MKAVMEDWSESNTAHVFPLFNALHNSWGRCTVRVDENSDPSLALVQ